ncbi:MAG TPA: LPS export ABC transporter ATP-binding protein [Chitinophagaceae bacterium]|nr:LPS export ABC transporter ATP-binding protein [Chitinophagaceae bacterium]
MAIAIHTKDLVKSYRNRTVVNHVSVDVKQGEIVGLLGPNGAGKTTTFYMVVGLIKPDEGQVFLDTEEITSMPMYKRAQLGIGYLPQEASVFRKLSVEDNIMAVLEMTKLSRRQQKEKLESLLDEFRLHHVRKNNGDALSGGERRRTEIARALAVDPKFMLLDEPFAGVDPIAVEDIQMVVARLKHKNIGILITDHNVNETLSICDRAYLLIEGKIFKHGTAEELAEDEQVRRLYLGRNFELKRKDYLHEEARQSSANRVPSLSNLIRSLESALAMNEQIEAADRAEDRAFRGDFSSQGKELREGEYYRFLDSIKDSIHKFAAAHPDAELKRRAALLNETNGIDLHSWIFFLKNLDSQPA